MVSWKKTNKLICGLSICYLKERSKEDSMELAVRRIVDFPARNNNCTVRSNRDRTRVDQNPEQAQ